MKNKKFGGAVIALFMAAIAMFSACADNADNGRKLTADTNVSDIQSEKVADEAAWKAAFARENYPNYSVKMVGTITDDLEEGEMEYKYTPGKVFYSMQITANETGEDGKTTKKITREETYLAGTADSYSAWMIVYENGVKTNEGKDDNDYYYLIDGEYGLTMVDELASIKFSDIKYDETQKGYICNPAEGMTATIKILNGIFVGMIATYKYGETTQSATMLIYDVGCTDITLPAALQNAKPTQDNEPTAFASMRGESVTVDEWETVFSNFQTIENFTMCFEDGTNTYFYYADAPVVHIIYSGKESYWYLKNSGKPWVYDMANPGWVSVMASMEPYSTFIGHMNPILRLFGSIYSQMTYDSTKKAYTAENITLDGTEIDYLEIKIADGILLGYLMEFGQTTYTCMLYNYGTTTVTLPQGVALPMPTE